MKYKAIGLIVAVLLLVVVPFGRAANDMSFSGPVTSTFLYKGLAKDTLSVTDTATVSKPPKDAIDAPVYYESTDSMVWSNSGNAYLYGSGKVVYDKIELLANVISMNMDSSVVHRQKQASH